MKTLAALGTLVLMSGLATADTILENGGAPTFASVPSSLSTNFSSGVPYWDNFSGDFGGTNTGNLGYFLTASGHFAGGTNYNTSQYLAAASGNPDSPAAFSLVRNTNSLLMTLLATYTGGSDTFGIYDASKTSTSAAAATEVPLLTNTTSAGTIRNESGIGFANYGFYVNNGGFTWFSNTALDVNDGAHQHFALFTSAADPNVFYLGVTDWFYGNGGEANGDYEDLVIRINSDANPEPATFALMATGLLGLGYARFRARKNRV